MKRREQALLLLRKAAQDEALLAQVLHSPNVSDEIVGFHCQQAAEKLLKALLSDMGTAFRRTHELGALVHSVLSIGMKTTMVHIRSTGVWVEARLSARI
ncbi:MAG TPA: HEPN domain-containing protein [Bryobacteraceae bacterium]|nr:HEPN domain-containing protein [Bryobacteraceae bacterium]